MESNLTDEFKTIVKKYFELLLLITLVPLFNFTIGDILFKGLEFNISSFENTFQLPTVKILTGTFVNFSLYIIFKIIYKVYIFDAK